MKSLRFSGYITQADQTPYPHAFEELGAQKGVKAGGKFGLAADKSGCSFWADSTIARKIGLREGEVVRARQGLLQKGFIAYRYPLHQILPAEEWSS